MISTSVAPLLREIRASSCSFLLVPTSFIAAFFRLIFFAAGFGALAFRAPGVAFFGCVAVVVTSALREVFELG